MVERGELTPEEGATQMANATRQIPVAPATPNLPAPLPALGMPSQGQASEPEVVEDFESVYAFWRNWWILPLSVGAIVFVLGTILIAWGSQSGMMFWLFCGIFPLLLGLGVMMVSFWSRTARWLHIRIRESKGAKPTRVAISMPIPIQLIGWGLKTFGQYIPGLREQPQVYNSLPEIMQALEKSGDPLVVEVNEKNGDEVRVYIM
jgi:hypothetical protein